jgi:hypothetical protein
VKHFPNAWLTVPREQRDQVVARHLSEIARSLPLIAAATPCNFHSEIERLIEKLKLGKRPAPAFTYRSWDHLTPLVSHLEKLFPLVEQECPTMHSALQELTLEARLIVSVGTPAFPELARQRFGTPPQVDSMAHQWANLPLSTNETVPTYRSDDERCPDSLVYQMRKQVLTRKIPFQIKTIPNMAASAATGHEVILIAANRQLPRRTSERIVVHEIEGHVLPRWKRSQMPTFTFHNRDEEEGLALHHEEVAGYLDTERRKELGLRHLAAVRAHGLQPLQTIAEELEALGAGSEQALRLSARACRGGGLGRERIYLFAYTKTNLPPSLTAFVH